MRHYSDKCPLCGSHINISGASICPGCHTPLFYGPARYGEAGGAYYVTKEEYEEAIEESRKRFEADQKASFMFGSGLAIVGLLIWSWADFRLNFIGCFGVVLLAVGVFMAWATS